MLQPNQIAFDDNLDMFVQLNGFEDEIRVTLSDDLYATEEELTDGYKEKIASFINNIGEWYSKTIDTVLERAKNVYKR